MSLKIKKGDIVEVISGSAKYDPEAKKRGRVIKVLKDKNRILVEEVNKRFKHMRPSAQNPKGGRIEREMSLALSNVMLVCPACGKTTRVKARTAEDGSKARYCMRCDKTIETAKKTG